MQMDIGRAFGNLFKGEKWFEKIFIGMVITGLAGLAAFIPHIGVLVSFLVSALCVGYAQQYMRLETTASVNALPDQLPEWTDWQGLLKEGVLLQLIVLCWTLLFGAVAGSFGLMFYLSLAAAGAAGLHGLGILGIAAAIVLAVLLGLALFFATVGQPLLAAHYAHEQRFEAGFEVRTAMGIAFRNPLRTFGVFLLSVLTLMVAGYLASFVVGIPMLFMAHLIIANLWAQVYRISQNII